MRSLRIRSSFHRFRSQQTRVSRAGAPSGGIFNVEAKAARRFGLLSAERVAAGPQRKGRRLQFGRRNECFVEERPPNPIQSEPRCQAHALRIRRLRNAGSFRPTPPPNSLRCRARSPSLAAIVPKTRTPVQRRPSHRHCPLVVVVHHVIEIVRCTAFRPCRPCHSCRK